MKAKAKGIRRHLKSPMKRVLGSFIDDPTEEELLNNQPISHNWNLSSPESIAESGWHKTFSDAWTALEHGEEGARKKLRDLTVLASALLDEFLPSTIPGALMRALPGAPLQTHRVLMLKLAMADALRFVEKLNAAYSSIHGRQSAEVRRTKAAGDKGWQASIRDEAVRLLSKSKMSAKQIADRLSHLAPEVKPDTIRKYVSKLKS